MVACSSAEYRTVPDHPLFVIQLRRNNNPAVVACWGIPHNCLLLLQAVEEHAAVATSEVSPMVRVTAALPIADRRTEAFGWDEIQRVHYGSEERGVYKFIKEADKRGIRVAGAEAAAEVGISDEAAPALADERGAGKRGGPRRLAEEDLGEDVVVVW
jgi:hypothetical protein